MGTSCFHSLGWIYLLPSISLHYRNECMKRCICRHSSPFPPWIKKAHLEMGRNRKQVQERQQTSTVCCTLSWRWVYWMFLLIYVSLRKIRRQNWYFSSFLLIQIKWSYWLTQLVCLCITTSPMLTWLNFKQTELH